MTYSKVFFTAAEKWQQFKGNSSLVSCSLLGTLGFAGADMLSAVGSCNTIYTTLTTQTPKHPNKEEESCAWLSNLKANKLQNPNHVTMSHYEVTLLFLWKCHVDF